LQLGYFTSGGSSTLTNANTNFNGYGNAVRTVHANQPDMSASGAIFTITRTGGAAAASVGNGNQDGGVGNAGTLSGTSMGAGSGGKGGIGSVSGVASDFPLGYSGAGGAFGGGSGATSVRYSGDPGAVGNAVFGGAGVAPVTSGSNAASGGVGNPGGAAAHGGQAGTDGTGGIIILIVAGDLTISGTISANGNGNDTLTTNAAIGGSAGGGAIMALYKGTLANSGTVQALGGAASTVTQGTLVDEGTWGTDKKILGFHDLDISAQPSGVAMCYKITTHNQVASSKETRVYATSIGWR
jgi:hypothetical protein